MKEKIARKKAFVNSKECVACGVCVKTCPLKIINIQRGSYALVNSDRCIGCQKCFRACPALAIEMR